MRAQNQTPVEDRLDSIIRDLEVAESRGAWNKARSLELEADRLVHQVEISFELEFTVNQGKRC